MTAVATRRLVVIPFILGSLLSSMPVVSQEETAGPSPQAARPDARLVSESAPAGVPARAPFDVNTPLQVKQPEETSLAAGPSATRPHVVLVLSGGGARGTAHIGVLKVLEAMRVPVDMVVGTSMGSIVGGLYASGWSSGRIESLLLGTDFRHLFIDQVAREDKTFRRKQDDATFLIPTKLRFKGWVPSLPASLLGGQRLELFFRAIEIESTGESDFDRFPIPYRAVAADLATGEAVVLDHGSLATAMRASMSVAGVFAPVEYEGHKLVDGGAAANLPIGIARDLGAESIIAVDITSPLNTEEQLGSVLSIVDQMTSFLTVRNRVEDLNKLRSGDVLIHPELGDLKFTSFDRVPEGIAAGEAAARAAADQLRRFSVSEEEYAAFQARHHTRDPGETVVDRVVLDNTSWVDDRVVLQRLPDLTGKPLGEKSFQRDIMRLYGLDYFGVIRPEFERSGALGELTLHTPLKPYGRNSLQFGLSLRNDFDGSSTYSFAIRHLLLAANRRGGEWENVGQLGSTSLLSTRFYQPLDPSMRWFVTPFAGIRRENWTVWADGEAVAEYRTDTNRAALDVGRVFGDWGEIRAGAYYTSEEGEVRVGSPLVPDYKEHDGGLLLSFRVDTLDSSVFPRRGMEVLAQTTDSTTSLGSDVTRRQNLFVGRMAFTFGRNTLFPGMEAGWTPEGATTVGSAFRLGGLGRLSGLHQDELLGEKYGLARLVYYRELKGLDLGTLSNRVYAGASLEAGNAYTEGEPVTAGSLRHGGGVFLGAKTVIGPVYLGYGFGDGGDRLVYFFFGERF